MNCCCMVSLNAGTWWADSGHAEPHEVVGGGDRIRLVIFLTADDGNLGDLGRPGAENDEIALLMFHFALGVARR